MNASSSFSFLFFWLPLSFSDDEGSEMLPVAYILFSKLMRRIESITTLFQVIFAYTQMHLIYFIPVVVLC